SKFDHGAELLRFFDLHLRGIDRGLRHEKPVHYFTMVEEKWKAAETWPPPATMVRHYFAAGGKLMRQAPLSDGHDSYRVDYAARSGDQSRWLGLAAPNAVVCYPDRQRQDARLLVYESAPLEESTEVTGHPVITLYLSSTAPDGNVIAYLEDVDRSGC